MMELSLGNRKITLRSVSYTHLNPPADYDVRTRDWYKKIFASTGITYTDVYESASNHKLMADVGCPIVVNGKKICLLYTSRCV